MIKKLILLLLITTAAQSFPLYYFSIGLGIGTDFRGNWISTKRIGIGEFMIPGLFPNTQKAGIYGNITVGFSTVTSSSSGKEISKRIFIEPQMGSVWGGGIGTGISIPLNGSDEITAFRLTAFGGFIGFVTTTLFISNDIHTELVGDVGLPIPFYNKENGAD
jgi:hypothetical protein